MSAKNETKTTVLGWGRNCNRPRRRSSQLFDVGIIPSGGSIRMFSSCVVECVCVCVGGKARSREAVSLVLFVVLPLHTLTLPRKQIVDSRVWREEYPAPRGTRLAVVVAWLSSGFPGAQNWVKGLFASLLLLVPRSEGVGQHKRTNTQTHIFHCQLETLILTASVGTGLGNVLFFFFLLLSSLFWVAFVNL